VRIPNCIPRNLEVPLDGTRGSTGKFDDLFSGDCPDDGGSKHLWNVDKLLPDYTAQQPRRQSSSLGKEVYKWSNLEKRGKQKRAVARFSRSMTAVLTGRNELDPRASTAVSLRSLLFFCQFEGVGTGGGGGSFAFYSCRRSLKGLQGPNNAHVYWARSQNEGTILEASFNK
jgi:hypothetical protein